MKIGAIFQDLFRSSPIQQTQHAGAIPAHAIRELTGARNLRLTEIDGTRTGQRLNQCVDALRRYLRPAAAAASQQPLPHSSKAHPIAEDLHDISKKVSQLDIKHWMKSQKNLGEMLDISRTVLRLSYAVKSHRTPSDSVDEPDTSPPITGIMAAGLADISLSLVDDILKQSDILLQQDKTPLNNSKRDLISKSMLEKFKEDKALCKKLFESGALPLDIQTKAESLKSLEESVQILHNYLKDIVTQTEEGSFKQLIATSKDILDTFAMQQSLMSPAFLETMKKTMDELEKQYASIVEMEEKLNLFLERLHNHATTDDDLIAWLRYLAFPAKNPAFMRASEEYRREELERIALPEYHFELE